MDEVFARGEFEMFNKGETELLIKLITREKEQYEESMQASKERVESPNYPYSTEEDHEKFVRIAMKKIKKLESILAKLCEGK